MGEERVKEGWREGTSGADIEVEGHGGVGDMD